MPENPPKSISGPPKAFPSEDAAKDACERLSASHADRATHQWLPRRTDRGWQVVKVAVPPPVSELIAETHAEERPPTADDPRVAQVKNCGPYGAPI